MCNNAELKLIYEWFFEIYHLVIPWQLKTQFLLYDYSLDICKDNFKNTYLIFKPNNSFIFPLKLPPYDNYALLFPSHQHGYEKTN
jgi:hypothetical protein